MLRSFQSYSFFIDIWNDLTISAVVAVVLMYQLFTDD